MQAQRKHVDPALTAPPADAMADRAVPADHQISHEVIDGVTTSPAILLQQQLAARLKQAEASTAQMQGVVDAPEAKLPVGLRVATIVTLSVALWGGIFLSAAALLT